MRFTVLAAVTLLATLAAAAPCSAGGGGGNAASGTSLAVATQVFAVVPPSSTSTDPHDQFRPDVVKEVLCGAQVAPPLADQQAAELAICGSIKAPIDFCEGNPSQTTGVARTAKWTLTAPPGGVINVFKGSWEECCNAARAACPDKTFSATCLGGVSQGEGFTFALESV